MTKAFIFDIGEVLTTCDFSFVYADFAQRVGVESSIVEEFYRINIAALLTGKISTQETLAVFGIQESVTELQSLDIWKEEILKHSNIDKQMITLLKKLKENYTIIALSNVTESRIAADSTMGIYDYFDDIVLSFNEGLKKPDPSFFQIALKKANCSPHEIIYIDDQINNVHAARLIGWSNPLN